MGRGGFWTGVFSVDGVTTQKFHHNENFEDDDVLSWAKDNTGNAPVDGYVSNIRGDITIHISNKYINDVKILRFIRSLFGLYTDNGIDTVEVVPLESNNLRQ